MKYHKVVFQKCFLFCFCIAFSLASYSNENFTLLYHISNVGAPDFTKYGFKKSKIIYEQYLYNHEDDRDVPIIERKIKRQVDRIKRDFPLGSYVQLDIEGWQGKSEKALIQVREKYRSTLQRFQQQLGGYKLGYYRIVPVWAHWDMYRRGDLLLKWEQENTQRQKIADLSDVLYPSLYTYHKDPAKWAKTAIKVMSQARKMAKGKPVIPFLWPKFHPSSDVGGKGKVFIPKAYWRKQLELVFKYADGFVIWNDGRTRIWSNDFPWWQATSEFLETHFPDNLPSKNKR